MLFNVLVKSYVALKNDRHSELVRGTQAAGADREEIAWQPLLICL
jgi:hypothetical protein